MSASMSDELPAPRQNNEAEMCVLGCMVLSERAADEIEAALKEADFYIPAHREIFKSIRIVS